MGLRTEISLPSARQSYRVCTLPPSSQTSLFPKLPRLLRIETSSERDAGREEDPGRWFIETKGDGLICSGDRAEVECGQEEQET